MEQDLVGQKYICGYAKMWGLHMEKAIKQDQLCQRNYENKILILIINWTSMAEDISSTASNTIPFPTLTIVYLVSQAEGLIDEISQKYNNITVEDCNGFFNDGLKRDYKKITIWSQGIDSLWFNALIARIKEIANVDSVPIVSGGIMYSV